MPRSTLRRTCSRDRGDDVAVIFKGEGAARSFDDARRALSRGRGVRGRRSAVRASALAIASPATCRICPKRSSPRSPRQRSARCGRRARLTSARRAFSTDSDRSSRRYSSPQTDTHTAESAMTARPRIAEVVRALPSVQRTVLVRYLESGETAAIRDLVTWDDFLSPGAGSDPEFEPLPFNHPLYILYSSGTTGVPKCIVHGAGGTLIQHLKEHQLHCDIRAGDRVFYFTTCGWMMWNWLVSALASDATLVLYDGSPFYPDGNVAVRSGGRDGRDALRHLGQVHRCGGQGGPRPDARRTGWTPCARSPRPARRSRRRASTSSTNASSATSTSPRSPAAPTSSVSSPAGIPMARSGAARFRRGRSA